MVDHLEQLIGTNEVKKEIQTEKLELKELMNNRFNLNQELNEIEKERIKIEPQVKKFNK